jgi:CTP synthase (UTP-ammonia lyase)
MKIALLGDYGESVVAHQAIPVALSLAARALSISVDYEWVHSNEVDLSHIKQFDALWCVPFSPYQNPDGVLAAIELARNQEIPFLGTCAGFQHAVLEYARNALGFAQAESSEDNPQAEMPLINTLVCQLYDASETILVRTDTQAAAIYQTTEIFETYHCGYGVNSDYISIFDNAELKFSGHDRQGDPRILEVPQHRFFIATAFQPERSALNHCVHPLIVALLTAAL